MEKAKDDNSISGNKMRKVKSIDRLYEDVRDYDLVITNDAALATALNKMVDKPTVGPFAMTAQQIAAQSAIETLGRPLMSELKVAMAVHEETGIDFRTVHSTIKYIQEVRRYTSNVESHLFTEDARRIYKSYKAAPTLEKVMEQFDSSKSSLFLPKEKIAVIGPYIDYECDKRFADLDLFNDLEKRMIPPGSKEILIYEGTEEDESNYVEYDIERIYQIGNDRQIADNAVALIVDHEPTDFAIVLKSDSALADAVRAALYRKNIPFVNELNVKDLNQVRDYLEFISLSLSFETIRMGDIRELFSTLGYPIPEKMDEHLVSKELFTELGKPYQSKEKEELRLFMKDIRNSTFEDVRKKIFSGNSSSVKILLDDLKLTNRKVTSTLLSRAIYAVENVGDLHHNEQIPPDEKEGVLIADCGNSVYIDRPVVIYLGMEQDWNLDLSNKKYVQDKVDEMRRAAVKLEVLLQQGERRFYIVNTSKEGEEPCPCLSFDDILSKPVKKFSDICSNIVRASWVDAEKKHGNHVKPTTPDVRPYDGNLSQSSLSQFYKCPRAFMFHTLVPSDEDEKMEFGNIIHEFAEFYVTHRDIVEEKGIDYFIDKACERFSGITTPMTDKLDRCKISCAMRSVKAFLDSIQFDDIVLDKPIEEGDNYFFECVEPKIEMSSTACEADRKNDRLHIHGKMDLYTNGVIIDYKTGKTKSGKDIVKAMNYVDPPKYPDFQSLIYLAIARELNGSKNEFDLFYAMNNDTLSGDDYYDVQQNLRKVHIVDMDDREFLHSQGVFKAIESKLPYNSRFKKDTTRFIKCISDSLEGPASTWTDQASIAENAVVAEFPGDMNPVVNAVKAVIEMVQSGIAGSEDEVYIRSQILDSFLEEIGRKYSEIVRMSKTDFPANPAIICEDCNYYSICTADRASDSEEGDLDE